MSTILSTESVQLPVHFGRYKVECLLGEGGMGKVYLADDPVLGRKVAIKVTAIDPGLDSAVREEFIRMSDTEARASAKLDHPAIVQVYDAGEQDGHSWIAFQYVQGETLESILRRKGKIPVRRAVAFALDIASALQHAHSWSIIHRDVKPANILVESGTGIAKLADFGIVKAPWTKQAEGLAVGSPGYMCPEQINGTDLDERADLFCLGVVMYEMLTGRNPFVRESFTATITATCNGDYQSLEHFAKDIPTPLDWAVRRCLETDRDKRLSSATQLIDMLKKAFPEEQGTYNEKSKTGDALTRTTRVILGPSSTPGIAARTIRDTFISCVTYVCKSFVQSINRSHDAWRAALVASLLLTINTMVVIIIILTIRANSPSFAPKGSVEGQLAAECLNALDRSERVLAHKAVSQLLEIGAAYPYTHLLMARVMIRDGDYSNAARHIVKAQLLDGGKKTMKKELPVILEEIGTRLAKGAAPAALIDIVVFTLSAGDHISVKKWAESENYWLQRNAELIRKKSQLERE